MTAALTPARALAYLTALSADIQAAAILAVGGEQRPDGRADGESRAGERRAGDAALAAAVRRLPPDAHGATATHAIHVATDDRHTIAVVTGPFALPGLTRHDLRAALAALGGQAGPAGPPTALDPETVNVVIKTVFPVPEPITSPIST